MISGFCARSWASESVSFCLLSIVKFSTDTFISRLWSVSSRRLISDTDVKKIAVNRKIIRVVEVKIMNSWVSKRLMRYPQTHLPRINMLIMRKTLSAIQSGPNAPANCSRSTFEVPRKLVARPKISLIDKRKKL